MLKNKFIKHEKSVDVCFKILNLGDGDALVDVWNMGQSSAYPIGEYFTIPISKLNESGWQECENAEETLQQNQSLRSSKWKKLEI